MVSYDSHQNFFCRYHIGGQMFFFLHFNIVSIYIEKYSHFNRDSIGI